MFRPQGFLVVRISVRFARVDRKRGCPAERRNPQPADVRSERRAGRRGQPHRLVAILPHHRAERCAAEADSARHRPDRRSTKAGSARRQAGCRAETARSARHGGRSAASAPSNSAAPGRNRSSCRHRCAAHVRTADPARAAAGARPGLAPGRHAGLRKQDPAAELRSVGRPPRAGLRQHPAQRTHRTSACRCGCRPVRRRARRCSAVTASIDARLISVPTSGAAGAPGFSGQKER